MRASLDFKMRLYRIDQLIRETQPTPLKDLMRELDASEPTVKRDIQYLRTKMNAPIIFDRGRKGYVYGKKTRKAIQVLSEFKMPATWYSPTEVYVALRALQMFGTVEQTKDGLLCGEMPALKSRVLALFQDSKIEAQEITKRIRIVETPIRIYKNTFFEVIGGAIAQRKRLNIRYYTRSHESEADREVSPLRLVWYRNRWYLDAWCHQSEALKTFCLDYIRHALILSRDSKNVSMKLVEEKLDNSYGIFSGDELQTAEIEIDALMAEYVRDEFWHKNQVIESREDGSMLLKVPYAQETELAGQILRLGTHAKVLAPASLRRSIVLQLSAVLAQYKDKP